MAHCSFCRRGSRAVVFSGGVSACGACTLAVARLVTAASDEELGAWWRIAPAAPASEAGHEVRAILSEFRAGIAERIATDDSDGHYSLALGYRDIGLYDAALQELYLARRGAADARLAEIEALGAVTLRDAGRDLEALRAAAAFIATRERVDDVVVDVLLGAVGAAAADAIRSAIFAD